MHPLQRALIEKAGHDNGFEYVLSGDAEHATLASARHPARVRVAVIGQGYEVGIDSGSATLAQELAINRPGARGAAQARSTAPKAVSVRTSKRCRRSVLRREWLTWSSSGTSTRRGSGVHHRMGSPSLNQGKMPRR